jgi:hypothetical protein
MFTSKWRVLSLLSALALVTMTLLGQIGRAAPVSAQSQGVELTVYNQDLGLVSERRSLDLVAGVNQVQFTDVAAQIDPTSVHFQSLTDPSGTSVLEQNYEYDIVGSAKLLQKYVDQEIRVVTDDGKEYVGTLLNGESDLILQQPDGAVVVLKLEQIKEYGLPALPEGLITRPTLVWQVEASKAGAHDVEVTYLTGGINWLANYVVVLADDEKSLDLDGWVTLDNRSGATYKDAKLKLIAGDIHRAPTAVPTMDKGMAYPEAAPAPAVEERGFFEYHLYEVQRPVTVKDQQTKQIEFVTATGVPAAKYYVYNGSQMAYYPTDQPVQDQQVGAGSSTKVAVMLEFENSQEAGLGVPLPKGTVRVFKNDVDGSTLLVGEDAIDHTPKDEQVRLYIGDAFDIVGERKQVDFKADYDDNWIEESYEITLRNHKAEAIEVRVVEPLFRWSQWTIVKSSQDYEKLDAQTIEFRVLVKADGEATLTYTVRYEW